VARPRVTESDAVLDAAAQRLASHGIAATTVDDVAAEAGVSRATVYRYIGGKNQLVPAVIGRETEAILVRLAEVIGSATTAHRAIADVVSTALLMITESPVLARLTSTDLRATLPYITVDSLPLVDVVVSTVSDAIRTAPHLTVDERAVEDLVEEATRFVLTHLTTPRRDGSRLGPQDAGERAAELIAPWLESVET
jgi:AcrR family transcriptional regulator